MNDGLTLPLAVRTTGGAFLGALLMNRKSFNKSIERREIWVVHPETGRVLPLDGVGFESLSDRAGVWYEAVVAGKNAETLLASSTFRDPSVMAHPGEAGSSSSGGVQPTLEKLRAVIAQRRAELPEGSYTTHLFQKGEEKIRKKLGEEAVELILARDRSEIVSEAADLIYHLMVLLEVKDLPVGEVLAELENRLK